MEKIISKDLVVDVIQDVLGYAAEHPETEIKIFVDEFSGLEIDINPAQRKE